MVAVTDQDQRISFLGELDRLHMDLGHQRASRVNHSQSPLFAGFPHFGRNPMGAVDHSFAVWELFDALENDRAFSLQLLNHKTVVDNFFAHIDWRAKSFQGNANDLNLPYHSRTETPGAHKPEGYI